MMKIECSKCKKDVPYQDVQYFADDYKFCFQCTCEFKVVLYDVVKKTCVSFIRDAAP